MPICPNCKVEFRQRKDGCCPNDACGEPLQLWKGFAFREGIGSPSVAVLEHFERLVSKRTSIVQKKPIVWRVPRKSTQYPKELVSAERLLNYCEYDFDLVIEILDTLFLNPQFQKRNYNSLSNLFTDFTVAQAIVEANREKAEVVEENQSVLFSQIMQRENIFFRDSVL